MPRVPIVERNLQVRPLPAGNTAPMLGTPRLDLPSAGNTGIEAVGRAREQMARAVGHVGEVFGKLAEESKQRGDQVALIEAQRKLDDWEASKLYDSTNGAFSKRGKEAFGLPNTLATQFDLDMQEVRASLGNDDQRIAFDKMAVSRLDTIRRGLLRHERQEMDDYARSQANATIESGLNRAQLNYSDPVAVENSINNAKGAFAAYAKTQGLPQEAIEVKLQEIDRKGRLAVLGRMAIENPEELLSKIESRKNPADGFESAVSWVIRKEGGYVSNDAGRGPTKYGINSEANPGVDIENLTPQGAKEIYREKYWKKIGADSMPPELAMVAFDAAVNHGVGKAKALLEESGNDPQKLISLREKEYRRLAEENPEKYGKHLNGWLNRLQDLSNTGGGDSGVMSFDALPWQEQRQVINAAESRVREVRSQRRTELEGRLKDSEAMAFAGVTDKNPPTRDDFLKAYGADEGDSRFQQYAETQEFAKNVRDVATQTPAQQNSLLESLKPQEGEGFADRQKRYELLGKAVTEVNKQRQDDPIAFAMQHNLTKYTEPLNFSSAENFAGQMRQRADISVTMRHLYGTPPRAFTKAETEQLKNFLQTAQPEQQLALVNGLYQGFGKNTPEVLEPLADKDKVFAHYAALASVDEQRGPSIALDAFRGRAILASNPKSAPSDSDALASFREIVGNAFQYLPEAESALYDSAKALYVKRAYDAGSTEAFDRDIFEQSINDAMGAASNSAAFTSINGRVTVLPAGIKDGEFEDFLSMLKPEDALELSATGTGPVDSRGRQIRPEDMADYGEFIAIGNGVYKIKFPDGFVKTGDGVEDYVLTVTPERIRKVLAR